MPLIVHMVGNAHIDPVWLWNWQAKVDEALASFRAAADRCDEYPEFIYTRGEAWLYQQVERLELTPRGIRQLSYCGRELLEEGGIGLHLREDSTDTWTFHSDRFT